MADKTGNAAYRTRSSVKRHWEKKCFMQNPPKAYSIASDALPFTQARPIDLHPTCGVCKSVSQYRFAADFLTAAKLVDKLIHTSCLCAGQRAMGSML
jgi:hypothetical protein